MTGQGCRGDQPLCPVSCPNAAPPRRGVVVFAGIEGTRPVLMASLGRRLWPLAPFEARRTVVGWDGRPSGNDLARARGALRHPPLQGWMYIDVAGA